jgi:hypothetical protein
MWVGVANIADTASAACRQAPQANLLHHLIVQELAQQQMVSLKTVLENVLDRTFGGFDGLLQHGPTLADKDRYPLT